MKPRNPLLQKRALDALFEMYNDSGYATQQHHSDPDYTTQNGKMMGKGTEIENGALDVTASFRCVACDCGGCLEHEKENLIETPPTVENATFFKEGEPDLIVHRGGRVAAVRPSPSAVFTDKVDQSFGVPRQYQEEKMDSRGDSMTAAEEGEHGNFPDTGEYDFEDEAHIREEAGDWAQYAENGGSFDPSGDYLCGTCDMRRGTNECTRVDGEISFTDGSCRLYRIGEPNDDPPMKKKFTKEDALYTERPHEKGFGCKRCEYGGKAKGSDPEGRESWCSFWGMHVIPDACCAENEGDDDTVFTEAGGNIDVPLEAVGGESEKAAAVRKFHEDLKTALGQSDCHHERTVCKGCGNVQTCRCSAKKVTKEVASCSNCEKVASEYEGVSDETEELLKKQGTVTKSYGTGTPLGGTPNQPSPEEIEDEEKTAAAPDAAVQIKETPKFLPPRDDMRRHIDQGEKDAVMTGVKDGVKPQAPAPKPKQIDPSVNPDGVVASDKTADLGWEMRQDEMDTHFNDEVAAVKREAKGAFMEDGFMQQQAVDAEMSMDELWKEIGDDYTNNYFESVHARTASQNCPNCKNVKGKLVKDGSEHLGTFLGCPKCGSFFDYSSN